MSWLILFSSAFLAATLLPFYSEVVLVGMIFSGESLVLLWAVATLGNTLGAGVNWALGKYLLRYQNHRWFPFKQRSLSLGQKWFHKYGQWSLLFAWLPVGGDALTFIAGMMNIRLSALLVLAGIGKGIRYVIVIALTLTSVDAYDRWKSAPADEKPTTSQLLKPERPASL